MPQTISRIQMTYTQRHNIEFVPVPGRALHYDGTRSYAIASQGTGLNGFVLLHRKRQKKAELFDPPTPRKITIVSSLPKATVFSCAHKSQNTSRNSVDEL